MSPHLSSICFPRPARISRLLSPKDKSPRRRRGLSKESRASSGLAGNAVLMSRRAASRKKRCTAGTNREGQAPGGEVLPPSQSQFHLGPWNSDSAEEEGKKKSHLEKQEVKLVHLLFSGIQVVNKWLLICSVSLSRSVESQRWGV